MSSNGEVTAVHISRKYSQSELTDSVDENEDFDYRTRLGSTAEVTAEETSPSTRPRPKPDIANDKPESGRHKSKPPGDKMSKKGNFLRADSDKIDLERLMQSMLDINAGDSSNKYYPPTSVGKHAMNQRPFSAFQLSSTRMNPEGANRDMHDDSRSSLSDGRKDRNMQNPLHEKTANFTFSDTRVRKIDYENRRLLKEIRTSQAKISSTRQPVVSRKREPVRAVAVTTETKSRRPSKIELENLVCNVAVIISSMF